MLSEMGSWWCLLGLACLWGEPARLPSLCKLAERLENRKRRAWDGPRQPENVRTPYPAKWLTVLESCQTSLTRKRHGNRRC